MDHRNQDGWGLVYYDEQDARIIRETDSANHSVHLDFIRNHIYPSTYMISHIREATAGEVKLKNTHPFSRELWGRLHTFAHKGELAGNVGAWTSDAHFRPIGETDSEAAFCKLMETLKERWTIRGRIPDFDERLDVISEFAIAHRKRGTFNFLYCDGEYIFGHGHQRRQPNGEMKPPGLHIIERKSHRPDQCEHHDIAGLHMPEQEHVQRTALLASVPLSAEAWQPLDGGSLAVLRQGSLHGVYAL